MLFSCLFQSSFSIHMFSTCFEMRFHSPFESSVGVFSRCRTKIHTTKTKMRIIGKAKRFLFRMHLAIPRHYQTPTQPCIITLYTTYKKKNKKIKNMMIETNQQRQLDTKLRKTTQKCINRRLRCNQSGR